MAKKKTSGNTAKTKTGGNIPKKPVSNLPVKAGGNLPGKMSKTGLQKLSDMKNLKGFTGYTRNSFRAAGGTGISGGTASIVSELNSAANDFVTKLNKEAYKKTVKNEKVKVGDKTYTKQTYKNAGGGVVEKYYKDGKQVPKPKASGNKSSKKDSTKPGGNISNKTSNPPIQNQPKKDFTKAFNDLKKGASGSTAQKGKDPIKENFEKMRNTKPSESKPKTTAGPTVAELWKQKTGMNWSEAKKQGVSDGSYASNTKLMKDLKAGKYDKKEPVGTLKLKSAQLMESGTKTPTELAKSSFKMGGKKVSMRKGMPLYKKGGKKK